MKVLVIGGGPAGMLAAYSAAKQGHKVILFEKNNTLGRKLLITGKGRCNITSSLDDMSDFIKNTPGNGRFLYSAYQNFTNKDIIDLINIPVKEERGNRIFPVSDRSIDVLNALIEVLKKQNIEIRTNAEVQDIIVENNEVIGIKVNNEIEKAEKVIIATGGKSYPSTGSTGDGYKFAKELGHTIDELKPALVGFIVSKEDKNICKRMQGLSLKNVGLRINKDKKDIYKDFGEMLFTHEGISGPIVLSASVNIAKMDLKDIKVSIDLKPALSEEQLDDRIIRDFDKYKNKEFKNSLDDLLPQKMIDVVVDLSGIESTKKVNEITKEERRRLVSILKNMEFNIEKLDDFDEAIITAGGISIKEINPKTMESKLVKGLFFAGEVIDVYAYTGGFNLQIAYSTGYTAGLDE